MNSKMCCVLLVGNSDLFISYNEFFNFCQNEMETKKCVFSGCLRDNRYFHYGTVVFFS